MGGASVIALGCDPGTASGGLVVLDTTARRVLLAYEWRPMKRRASEAEPTIERTVYDVHGGAVHTTRIPRSEHDAGSCGAALANLPAWHRVARLIEASAIEGVAPYGGRSGGISQASASRALGSWREWLVCQTGAAPVEVLPATWRSTVLGGTGGKTSGALDAAGERWCALTLRSPMVTAGGWDGACIAWWAGVTAKAQARRAS